MRSELHVDPGTGWRALRLQGRLLGIKACKQHAGRERLEFTQIGKIPCCGARPAEARRRNTPR